MGAIQNVARTSPGLQMLVLFGSRARGEHTETSDWDLGYLADEAFDPTSFLLTLEQAAPGETFDLANLATANGVLRYHAARDGQLLFEANTGTHSKFWQQAVHYWLDMKPVLENAHAQVLTELGP